MKHIVHIIPENSSSLDFTLPIFWKNSQLEKPKFKFSVIFFYLNKNAVLKHSKFYEQVATDAGVVFYDLTDFLLLPVFLKKSIRELYNYSSTDKIFISEPLNYYKNKSIFWPFLLFKYLTQNYNLKIIVNTIKIKILNEFAKFILFLSFSFKRVTEKLNISTILFDNRGRKNFLASKDFFNTVDNLKIPVVLIPHGAHYRTPESGYCQFLPNKIALPSYCRHWMPFKYGEPWKNNNTPKDQFKLVGYPGMDKDWLSYLKQKKGENKDRLNILYIIRRYVDRTNPMYKYYDYYIVDKKDVFSPLEKLINIIKDENIDANIIIKPHPKNSIEELQNDFKSLNYQNIEISSEPIYKLCLKTDIAISLHSTILFIPILMGIPTIIINNALHEKVVTKWSLLKDVYNNLSFFINDQKDLQKIFSKTINLFLSSKEDSCDNGIEHVYKYYNINSADYVLQDLAELHLNVH